MSDSELAALFDDLAECLGQDYIEASTTAAAHGETLLLSVYDACTRPDKHFVLYSRQPLTNMLCFVDTERQQLTTPPPPYVEPPQPEPRQRKYTEKTSV